MSITDEVDKLRLHADDNTSVRLMHNELLPLSEGSRSTRRQGVSCGRKAATTSNVHVFEVTRDLRPLGLTPQHDVSSPKPY